MKFLKFLSLFFLVSCVSVHADVINEFKIVDNYVAQVACNNTMFLNLVKKGKNVFSIDTKESCEDNVDFDANFFGRKAIHVSPSDMVPATASKTIYIVDTAVNKIIMAGSIPIMADQQGDRTFLYESLTPYEKLRVIYSFVNGNKIITKKSTMLIYNGSVCIRKSDDLGVYVDQNCDGGTVASETAPICVVRYHNTPSEIIPLDKCDIKKEEVSDLRE